VGDNKEEALVREIGYTPTYEDEEWEAEMKRNGVDVVRMKRIDKLMKERENEEYSK